MPGKKLVKSVSARISTLTELIDEALPLWDLCSDHGQIGLFALESGKVSDVTFVDIRQHLIVQLSAKIEEMADEKYKTNFICDDILKMQLPLFPVNFVIAGVGTNLIMQFLSRLFGRKGDRIICNTHQSPDIFEKKLKLLGIQEFQKIALSAEKPKTQTIWAFQL